MERVSSFGYAYSADGFNIDKRLEHPVFEKSDDPVESRGVEDPRAVIMDGTVYMNYTGYDGHKAHVCMASLDLEELKNGRFNWNRRGCILPVLPVPGKDDKNAALFPEKINGSYILIHRIPPDIWFSYSDDLKTWHGHKIIARPRQGMWDNAKIGAGGPPIRTEAGWLFIYHGVESDPAGGFKAYRLGFMLLDLKNPEKILFRSREPVLEPAREYEEQGAVQNVVFTCASVLIKDKIFTYYGGADTVICLATCKLDDLLSLAR